MDIAVNDGKIIEIAPTNSRQAVQEIQGHGNMLIPGFVEGNLQLEKANIMHRKANRSGTLKEAIAATAELKPTLTRDDIFERSTQALHALVQSGSRDALIDDLSRNRYLSKRFADPFTTDMTLYGEHARCVIKLLPDIFTDAFQRAAARAVSVVRFVMDQCVWKLRR